MARNKLTAGRIREFECPTGTAQAFLWDTEAPGLAVRATPGSEARGFIFQSRLNGKAIRLTIGDVRAWGIDAARAEARRLQTLIDQGTDPRQEKADKRAAIEAKKAAAEAEQEEQLRQAVTVGEAWAAYVAARSHKWGDSHKRDHQKAIQPGGERVTRGRKKGQGEYSLPGMVHSLLLEPLKDLTPERMAAWMQENRECQKFCVRGCLDSSCAAAAAQEESAHRAIAGMKRSV